MPKSASSWFDCLALGLSSKADIGKVNPLYKDEYLDQAEVFIDLFPRMTIPPWTSTYYTRTRFMLGMVRSF